MGDSVSGTSMGGFVQSFWPSFTALFAQYSTHAPQATQFSGFTSATKFEREKSGVLK